MSFKYQFENQNLKGSNDHYSTDDRFLFYGLNNYNSREFETSYLEGSGDWETLYDNEISFEFKTDMYGYEQVDYMRFTLFLICKKP